MELSELDEMWSYKKVNSPSLVFFSVWLISQVEMEGPEVKKSRMNIDTLDTVNSIKEMEFKLKMEENILKLYEELDKEKSEN